MLFLTTYYVKAGPGCAIVSMNHVTHELGRRILIYARARAYGSSELNSGCRLSFLALELEQTKIPAL